MVTYLKLTDIVTPLDDDPRSLMAQDNRRRWSHLLIQHKDVGMTHAGRNNLYNHLVSPWRCNAHWLDTEWPSGLSQNRRVSLSLVDDAACALYQNFTPAVRPNVLGGAS
jgi:hypothetical protein